METTDKRKIPLARVMKNRESLRFTILIVVLFAQCAINSPVITDTGAMAYLSRYGYLPPSNPTNGEIVSESTMSRAIEEFQSFAGLKVTGTLDSETATLMATPRCGVKDINETSNGRSKRYVLQGSRWRIKNLSYKITKYPRTLSRTEADESIRKAFALWSDVTDLTFTKKSPSSQVQIEIRFEKGEHGDGDPFDGPGGTLAHAYFPTYGGDAHFDDAEHWTFESYRGTNLYQVAAHEFGHALGLSHSDIKKALMAPFYRGYAGDQYLLDSDDIDGIQSLYGPKTSLATKEPRTTTVPTNAEENELCINATIDTMFNSADGDTYVFKGDKYWKLTENAIERGYPKLIRTKWLSLPGGIDAAFTYKNGKTYFFKGSQYWRYVGQRMDGDYPKLIGDGFTGIPDNVDGVTVWTGNGKIYFYKGTKFWRFDPTARPPVKSSYPKPLANWVGVPNNIDAAITQNGHTFFFKDNMYYRFNDRTFSVDRAEPAYPRSSGDWWFGCKTANRGSLGNVRWNRAYPSDNSFYYGNLAKSNDQRDNIYDDDDHEASIFNAGDTDEQLVTSLNQDVGINGSESVALVGRNLRHWALLIGLSTLSLARYLEMT